MEHNSVIDSNIFEINVWHDKLHFFTLLTPSTKQCITLYCTLIHCTALSRFCTVLHCTVLYCTALYCTVLFPPAPLKLSAPTSILQQADERATLVCHANKVCTVYFTVYCTVYCQYVSLRSLQYNTIQSLLQATVLCTAQYNTYYKLQYCVQYNTMHYYKLQYCLQYNTMHYITSSSTDEMGSYFYHDILFLLWGLLLLQWQTLLQGPSYHDIVNQKKYKNTKIKTTGS